MSNGPKSTDRSSCRPLFLRLVVAWFAIGIVCYAWWGVPFWNGPVGSFLLAPAVLIMGPFLMLTLERPDLSPGSLGPFAVLTIFFGLLGYAAICAADRGVRIGTGIIAVLLWIVAGIFGGIALAVMSV